MVPAQHIQRFTNKPDTAMRGTGLLLILLVLLTLACSRHRTEEEVLWEYYKGFTYSPGLFDSLAQEVRSKETKSFLMGLKCFEKYSQDKKADCYDSARIIFQELKSKYPANYVGHLGMGILLTERGKFTGEKEYFDSARRNYQRANRVRPKHPAIYYYSGRNEYNADRRRISVEAIQLLDTAIILKPDFFKATERSAEYLSHYLDVAHTTKEEQVAENEQNNAITFQKFNIIFPQAVNRIRYLFNTSLALDSTWQETYEGIAKAHRVYSTHDRINYLTKAIKIAEAKNVDYIDLQKTITNLHFFELNDYINSFNYFEKWIDVHGGPEDYVNRGWCYYYLGEKNDARKDFMRAFNSKSEKALFQAAQYYKLEHKYDSAILLLDWVIENRDEKSQLKNISRVEKVKMLMLLKRDPEARSILTQLLNKGSSGDYETLNSARILLESL
jgi:tetratricopeptide (TPR) repeat protein